ILTMIYFENSFQIKVINKLKQLFRYSVPKITTHSYRPTNKTIITTSILIFTLLQITIPLRFIIYDGDLFWKEEGYRFSWRVMLMEKVGTTNFTVIDKESGKKREIVNSDYLTKNQEIQMS